MAVSRAHQGVDALGFNILYLLRRDLSANLLAHFQLDAASFLFA